jgi:hypothetical protein
MRGLSCCFCLLKLAVDLNATIQGQCLNRSMNRVTEKTWMEEIRRVLSQVLSAHGWLDQTKQNLQHLLTSASKITLILTFQFYLTKSSATVLLPSRMGSHPRTGGFALFILGSDFAEKRMVFSTCQNRILIPEEV